MAVRIAYVDDNRVNRNTFAGKAKAFEDLQLLFVANNGGDCIRQLKELQPNDLPQVLFVDLEMPGLSGIEVIQIARVLYPAMHFIVLTVFDDDEKIFEAIKAGANGYLLKDDNAISLRNAISNSLEQGGAPMSASIARKALDMLSRSSLANEKPGQQQTLLDTSLSDREREILQCTIKGQSPKQIADALFISLFTVRKHIANIYQKLHINSSAQMLTLAYKNKWI